MISTARFHCQLLQQGSSSSTRYYMTWRGAKRNRILDTTTQLLFQQERRREVATGEDDYSVDRQQVLDEAAALTKSLYRLCIRSTHMIRHGNKFDEKEFQKREEEWANPSTSSGGIMSMTPPPDREDELRSRTEYYQAYAREYFVQESDCLNRDILQEKDIRRYLYYLKKGEKDRKWLLSDMMFPDPYKGKFDMDRVHKFETMAMKHLGLDASSAEEEEERNHDDDDDGYFDEEEEDPDWLKKKYPNLK